MAVVLVAVAAATAAPLAIGDQHAGFAPAMPPGASARMAAQAEAERLERETRRMTPEAREQRLQSRDRYRGYSRAEALVLAGDQFPEAMTADVWPELDLRSGESLKRYTGTHSALIERADGLRLVAASDVPLQAPGGNGALRPVELALERRGESFAPQHPIVPVTLNPAAANARFERSGLGVSLAGSAAPATPAEVVGDRLFLAEVAADIDGWLMPTPGGVEVFHQIRSADAPEEIDLKFDLPDGAILRLADGGFAGTAEVVRAGEVLASISPPLAHDADGERVGVETRVRGDRLVMTVAHRDGDYLYPILLDPQITEYSYWQDSGTKIGQQGWGGYTPNWSKWWLQLHEAYLGTGLYIGSFGTPTNKVYYASGEYAQWYLTPHRSKIHFPRAEFTTAHNIVDSCVYQGVWDSAAGWWAGNAHHQRCEGYATDLRVLCVAADCNWDRGPEGGPAVYGMQMSKSYERSSEAHSNLKRTAVFLWDRTPPSVVGVTGFPTRTWAREDTVNIGGSATDTASIGMQKVEIRAPGTKWSGRTILASNCDGTRFSPCPEGISAGATISSTETGLSGLEGIIPLDVTATEYIGRTATKRLGELRIDKSGPTVTIAGGPSGGTGTAAEDQIYELTITASDGTTSNRRSGVQNVDVVVDGEVVRSEPQSCTTDGCPSSVVFSMSFGAGEYADGTHTVVARARDQVGNVGASDPVTIRVDREAEYQREVDAWLAELATAADAGSPAPLTGPPPPPPAEWREPEVCDTSESAVRGCFAAGRDWHARIDGWLRTNGVAGTTASSLPPMPIFHYATSRLARGLTAASAGGYEAARTVLANPLARRPAVVSFSAPVSVDYLNEFATRAGVVSAWAFRGTFIGPDGPIVSGYNDGAPGVFLAQVEAFYNQQLETIPSLRDGLNEDLLNDETDEQRAGTDATLANVNSFEASLSQRAPLVSAVVADVPVSGLVAAAAASGSPIKHVRFLPDVADDDENVDADAAVAVDSLLVRLAPDGIPGLPPVLAASADPQRFMPRLWNGRTRLAGSANSRGLHRKDNYLGFKWTTNDSLRYYRGDDAHDRGFEAGARPERGGPVWSSGWGGPNRRHCLETTSSECRGGWNSNMPDAYRDDLYLDDEYKNFAIGTGDGRALRRNRAYFAYYLTNAGEADSGFAVEDGQATRRARRSPRGGLEWGYCQRHAGRDSACFFANGTAVVQKYPISNRFSRTRWP